MRTAWNIVCLIFVLLLAAGCDLTLNADERVARAERQLAQHNYAAASIELRNALQAEEDNARARVLLAQVSLRLGDLQDAQEQLQRAEQLGVSTAETAELKAQLLLEAGQAQELLAQLQSGSLTLNELLSSIYRGRALLALQRPEEAQAAFEQALALERDSLQAGIGLAVSRAAQGASTEAITELERLGAVHRQSAQLQLALASVYRSRGEFEKVERALLAAKPLAGTQLGVREQAQLLGMLSETQLARGDLQAARASQRELATRLPEAPLTRLLSARLSMAEQDYEAAAIELQRLIAVQPELATARFLLGAALFAQGNLNQAELQLIQALQRAPENLEARKLLALVQRRLQRPDSAGDALMSIPLSDESEMDLGGASQESQQPALSLGATQPRPVDIEGGLDRLRSAVAAQPDNPEPKLDLAAAYLQLGEAEKALNLLRSVRPRPQGVRYESLLVASLGVVEGLESARAEVERYLASPQTDSEALNFGALFHARQRQFDRARVLLAQAEQLDPGREATSINRARVEVAAGNAQEAVMWLRKALHKNPRSQAIRLALADLALHRSDTAAAIQVLEEARAQEADAIEARLKLARLYAHQRQRDKVDALLKEITDASPDRAEIASAVGLILLESGRYAEALTRFRRAADLAPKDATGAPYWFNVARAQLALGQPESAREALETTVSLRPDWPPAVGTQALIDLRQGRRARAMERMARLKRAHPNDPEVLTLEGDLYMAGKLYAEASAAYDAASALRPSGALALKSHHARHLGNLRNSTQPLLDWLKSHPGDTAVRMAMAEAYRIAGLASQAAREYELVLQDRPSDPTVMNNLAWVYHQLGDPRAEDTARRAHEIAPGSAAIADTYGWILVQNKKASQGLAILKAALKDAENQPDIEFHYAAALAATGARKEARRLLLDLLDRHETFESRDEAQLLLHNLPRS